MIAGIDLRALINGPGPLTTLYLNGGPAARERARAELDRAGSPATQRFADVLSEEVPTSRVLAAPAEGPVAQFAIVEPLRFDVARVGNVSSFGTLLEYHQFSAPHAVVTVEDDVFGLTSFGSVAVPDDHRGPVAINETVAATVEQLRFIEPKLLALVGSADELDEVTPVFRDALPHCWIQHYPTSDIDSDLESISDQIVRDARSRAAESLTHELAQFRTARDLGLAIEGPDVLACIAEGRASAALVHDDPTDDRLSGEDRLIDAVVHSAIARGVRLTMIPAIPAEQGPEGGLGATLRGDAPGLGSEQSLPDQRLAAGQATTLPGVTKTLGAAPTVA